MRVEFRVGSPEEWLLEDERREAVVLIPVFQETEEEGQPPQPTVAAGLNEAVDPTGDAGFDDFKAGKGEAALIHPMLLGSERRVVLAGLGTAEKLDPEALRHAGGAAARRARETRARTLLLPVSGLAELGEQETNTAVENFVTGALLGLYRYDALKTKKGQGETPPPANPERLVLLLEEELSPQLQETAERAMAVASGVCLARDLVNAPANVATPSFIAAKASAMAREYGFEIQVLERQDCEALGMGCFKAVYQGSDEEPRFVVLEHAPAGQENEAPVCLVGKGVTFDTGGISLKPSKGMEEMKSDMAGAAAVLGCFKILGELAVPRRVIGLLPLTENMPSGKAIKPGDVVTSLSGLSVEILNTDAEGRMLLADALAYAERYQPALTVDIATLTGACVVALGMHVSAVFCQDDALAREIVDLGDAVGDRFWPMPLFDLYGEPLSSEIADVKHLGPREGGAIHAAKFLERFAPASGPWVHLDIAGPSYASGVSPDCTKGGTGVGVRTLLRIVETQ